MNEQLECEEKSKVVPSFVIRTQNGSIVSDQDQSPVEDVATVSQNEMIPENGLSAVEPVLQVAEKEHNLGNGTYNKSEVTESTKAESELDSKPSEEQEWVNIF